MLFFADPAAVRFGFAGRRGAAVFAAGFLRTGLLLEAFLAAFLPPALLLDLFLATLLRAGAAFFATGRDGFAAGFFALAGAAGGRAGFFFSGAAGLATRAAFAFVADDVESALRREVLVAGGVVTAGRFDVRAESPARFFGPLSRVPRRPAPLRAIQARPGRNR